ncbi:GFA family protein, partial [Rhizobium ruizarguesonis]
DRFDITVTIGRHAASTAEAIGGAYVSINIACLDDINPEELAALPVSYADGRHDAWWNEPVVTSYI